MPGGMRERQGANDNASFTFPVVLTEPIMPLTVEQFFQELSSSGLMSEVDLTALESTHGTAESSADIAKALVQEGQLTPFQAEAVLDGEADALVLGNYIVQERIGSGGMGVVHKATHRRMERDVALKILPKAATDSDSSIRRFRREVKAAAMLDHPNIVTAHNADEAKGLHFFVMEYVDGRDLANLVKEDGPLPVARALDYIRQAAQGLAYAHSKGIVHRDIKPANLLVDKDEVVKVLDMGLARINPNQLNEDSDLTGSGQIMGTLNYMAPEQAENASNADQRADIYSLGCTLMFLLTAKPPYPGKSPVEVLCAHRTEEVPRLTDHKLSAPKLQELIDRSMAKQLEDRFPDMESLVEAIDGMDESVSPQTVTWQNGSAPFKESADQQPVNYRFRATVIAAALILVTIIASITVIWHSLTEDQVEIGPQVAETALPFNRTVTAPPSVATLESKIQTPPNNMTADANALQTRLRERLPSKSDFAARVEKLATEDQELSEFHRRVIADPNDHYAQAGRANRLRDLNAADLSLYDALDSAARRPNDANVWNTVAHGLIELSNMEDALEAFTVAVSIDPSDGTLFGNRAQLLLRLGRREEALRDFNQAVRISPQDSMVWLNRANYDRDYGTPQDALAFYSRAIEVDQGDYYAYCLRAEVLLRLSRKEEALADLNKAVEVSHNDAWPLEQRGSLLLRLGQHEQAVKDFVSARKIYPGSSTPDSVKADVEKALAAPP